MKTTTLSLITVTLSLVLAGCGPSFVTVRPRAPQATAQSAMTYGIANAQVSISPEVPGDRQGILSQYNVPAVVQQGVLDSFQMGGMLRPNGVFLEIQIHQFRMPRSAYGGPARLGARVTVRDPAGNVIETFDRESASMRGGSPVARLSLLSQDLVEKIIDET